MPKPAPSQRAQPGFFWQGLLILLPVAFVSAIALAVILQDRATVEAQARREAREIAQRLQESLGRGVASQLSLFDQFAYQWTMHQQAFLGGWPGSEHRRQWEEANSGYPRLLQEWQTNYPGLRPEETLPNDLAFHEDGRLRLPAPCQASPEPPAWLVALNDEQRAAWQLLRQGGDAADAVTLQKRAEAFFETRPPEEAAANARFLVWRQTCAPLPPEEATRRLRAFPWNDRRALSEAGVPLGTLAAAEGLRRARSCGMTEDLWQQLEDQVYGTPGLLTPLLLDGMESLVVTNAVLAQGVRAWRSLWLSQERLRGLAQAIQECAPLRGQTTTNLWIDFGESRWFCILSPGTTTVLSGNTTNAIPITMARVYPKAAVACAFAAAVREARVPTPDYFVVSTELEGESLAPAPRSAGTNAAHAEPALAQASGHLTSPAQMLLDHPQPGQPLPLGPEFESMPSRPEFTLRVLLANRAALFTAYRHRALVLGGCVGASAFAALAGVLAAWRGFRRQAELNEAKSNFVSSVSHELRAPIASVRLLAESLERGKVSEPARQRDNFRFILQECRRLSALIENVLDFSRIEQGRKEYEFEPVNVAALVEATVKLMEPGATEKQVRLAVDTAPLSNLKSEVLADARALQQALINLMDNAIKHSPAGETVNVSTSISPDSQTLKLVVSDHGPGIPAEDHERIFERFYRRGSELRRETPGVGIGLSIVKHVMEAHRGRVTVSSAAGQGSRFTLELPLGPQAGDKY